MANELVKNIKDLEFLFDPKITTKVVSIDRKDTKITMVLEVLPLEKQEKQEKVKTSGNWGFLMALLILNAFITMIGMK